MSYVTTLKCRECGQEYPIKPLHVCEDCFGPLEVTYDYAKIRAAVSRATIAARPHNLWRYRELLPVDGEPEAGPFSGFTPLVHARPTRRRARAQEALHQGRHRQPSDPLVQGPRGVGGDHQGARLRLHHRLMRLDRQSRDSGGGACGARGTAVA